MNKAKALVLLLFTALALTSCSSPGTKIYSIYIPPAGESQAVKKTAALLAINVTAVRYLTQPYITYRSSPFQLSISKYSKWYMPPDEIFRETLRDSLVSSSIFQEVLVSGLVPNNAYALRVHLKKFDRLDEENASFGELAFDFSLISPQGEELSRGTIAKRVKLPDTGFLGLAQGMSSALREGIKEVRANVGKSIGLRN
jgi:uncharacterized lipoprotein YmbA